MLVKDMKTGKTERWIWRMTQYGWILVRVAS